MPWTCHRCGLEVRGHFADRVDACPVCGAGDRVTPTDAALRALAAAVIDRAGGPVAIRRAALVEVEKRSRAEVERFLGLRPGDLATLEIRAKHPRWTHARHFYSVALGVLFRTARLTQVSTPGIDSGSPTETEETEPCPTPAAAPSS